MGDVLGRRVVAAVIDVAIIGILLVVIAKGLGNEEVREYSLWAETQGAPRALFFLLTFAYFFGTELAWAQTLGKRVMKLRVVSEDGTKPGAGPVAIRNLVRAVDWLPTLYIVGAITLFATGERRVRLGDLAARTKVVADDATPPQPPQPSERPGDDDALAQIMR
ncbi:MAG: RDD family protein [Actinomycetota bacterium]|nr:RDD family protein [Actinomycetota bacterium]